MKKIVTAVVLSIMLAGCVSRNPVENTSTGLNINTASAAVTTQSAEAKSSDSSTLIAWFSRVGNSDFKGSVDSITGASTNVEDGTVYGNNYYVEQIVERETGADEYFIQVQDLYPGSFSDTVQQFVQEERDDYFHPLATNVENMDQYDTIILIYPTWDSTLPSPVRTFLKSYDFNGKKIYPVNSNDGFGLGDSVNRIKTYAEGAEVQNAFSIDDDNFSQLEKQLTAYLSQEGLSR